MEESQRPESRLTEMAFERESEANVAQERGVGADYERLKSGLKDVRLYPADNREISKDL